MNNNLPENPWQLFDQANEKRDWHILEPYPKLLFLYQTKHKESVMEIAKFASHKLVNHKWCTLGADCNLI
jgi:hypothetical protein